MNHSTSSNNPSDSSFNSNNASDSSFLASSITLENNSPTKFGRGLLWDKYDIINQEGKNKYLRCKDCGVSGWHMSDFGKNHAHSHLNSSSWSMAIENYGNIKKRKRYNLPSVGDADDNGLINISDDIITVSADDIYLSALKFFISSGIAISKIDEKYFQQFVNNVATYSSSNHISMIPFPNRDTMIDNFFEKKLLISQCNDLIDQAQRNKLFGIQIIFDTVTDENLRTSTALLVRSVFGTTFIKSHNCGMNRKTSSYFTKLLIGDLECNELDESPQPINNLWIKLRNFAFVIISDNAASEQCALLDINKKLAIFSIGCMCHRFSLFANSLVKHHDNTLFDAKKIINLFRKKRIPKNIFMQLSQKKLLIQPAECRFMTWYLVAKRIILLQKVIKDVVKLQDFNDYKEQENFDERVKINDVINIIENSIFWDNVNKFIQIVEPIYNVLRLFDGCWCGSGGFVIRIWDHLKQYYEGYESSFNFHSQKADFPIYSASYLLSPYFYSLNQQLLVKDKDKFDKLKKQTIECYKIIFRRFNKNGEKRDVILEIDNNEVEEFGQAIDDELDYYFTSQGQFNDILQIFSKKVSRKNPPWIIWETSAPKSNLKLYAGKIQSIVASTSAIERFFKSWKLIRSKSRNRLTDEHSIAFSFSREQLNSSTSDSVEEWNKAYEAFDKIISSPPPSNFFDNDVEIESGDDDNSTDDDINDLGVYIDDSLQSQIEDEQNLSSESIIQPIKEFQEPQHAIAPTSESEIKYIYGNSIIIAF